jgi:type III restriction enzyme
MNDAVIENPIINTPFEEPTHHFKFSDEGITNEIVDKRRVSSYFVPIPKSRKRSKAQLALNTEWTEDRIQENEFINQIRTKVSEWRKLKYSGATKTTQKLLDYWRNPSRSRRLFFCQLEAVETLIYLTEIAPKQDAWMLNQIRQYNQDANPLLFRMAFKMATGSGKTVVMGMLIAYHVLNKLANSQDLRYGDAFLVVTPGITIKDRLRVLFPNDSENYYQKMDLVSSQDFEKLGSAKILITNFHAFKPREIMKAGKLTKAILRKNSDGIVNGDNPFTETPAQMVRRVCREFGNKKNILVINDEAHHCYRRKVEEADEEDMSGADSKEAEKRNEEARIWISGLEAVQNKLGVKAVYDLSATPFFLRGSGYKEGLLFQWVVSDFSLVDAIESGIVKVPRVPISDNSMVGDAPTYRDLWFRIREKLPKKGRSADDLKGAPKLPVELEGAILSLYENYDKYYQAWEQNTENRRRGLTPPVFIVVCNNTSVSKLVYDFISGYEKAVGKDKTALAPGRLPLFSNVEGGRWMAKPNTILVDSEQLESDDAMSPDFKKMAAQEIDEFKQEYLLRYPGRSADQVTDQDILREVMNTVGKPGKLGENVKCVVSVSMLTEGWDANTVTHILGVRAFGTQLLCEQVVGRGLRRMSYVAEPREDGKEYFTPEYAEVYGVPFSFIPCSGSATEVNLGDPPEHVFAVDDASQCEINFPRLSGYRYEMPEEKLEARFGPESMKVLSTADLPTATEVAPIVGEVTIHTLDKLKALRDQEVQFFIARRVMEKYFSDGDGNAKAWLFPKVLPIVRRWYDECLECKDDTFKPLVSLGRPLEEAAEKIYHAIVKSSEGEKILKPILKPFDTVGSTKHVDFRATKRRLYQTKPGKCHVNFIIADTRDWEQKLAESIEGMDEVISYIKNDRHLGFTIPYVFEGEERDYIPDFLIRVNDGKPAPLNLILEVTGEQRREKQAKAATARDFWVPAVNNDGSFGRWAYLEITDPWNVKKDIRSFLKGLNQ